MQCRRLQFDSWVGKICWRRDRLPTPVFLGFPGGSADREPTCNVRDLGLISGSGRSPGEGYGYPLQYSGLENCMDSIVHGAAKSWTQLSDFHFHFHCVNTYLNPQTRLRSEKLKSLLAKFREKIRMPTHPNSIQCSIGCLSHRSQKRKIKILNWKGRCNTVTICKWYDTLYSEP